MRPLFFVLLCVAVTGCAATYAPPITLNKSAVTKITKPKAEVLAAARRALVSNGYQITAFDDGAGVISTAPRDFRVYPEMADCGTTLGLDYLLDNRTTTRVAFGVIANAGKLEVKANIEGEYKPGSVDQNITLSCVSRGVLEHEMLRKIEANL